jgi:drug/metabolite transporter (DMT)-like permease
MKQPPTPKKHLLALGLALAIALDTAGQLVWKICIAGLPADSGFQSIASAALHQPLFVVLVAIFLSQLFNWLKVLERADLSYAQPITSLSYVTVCILSATLLNEHIGASKTIGVVCVLCGVMLVSRGKPLDEKAPHTQP